MLKNNLKIIYLQLSGTIIPNPTRTGTLYNKCIVKKLISTQLLNNFY